VPLNRRSWLKLTTSGAALPGAGLFALPQPYDGRPGCNHCANCLRGCPRDDKGSVDVTFVRKARESGRCTLRTDAPVRRLEPGADGWIRAVIVENEGRSERIRTRVLVLACGAVETPRLLLLSQGAHAPHGLANESGLVGRHFMETLFWFSTGLHPEALGSFRGVPSDIVSWTHNAPDAIPGTAGGCRFAAGVVDAGFVGPIAYATRAIAGWGSAHKRAMRDRFGRLLSVNAIGESLPNEGTYVDLDPAERDEAGDPVARIHSHLPPSELRRLRFMATKCRETVRATGAHELVEEFGTWDHFSATHVFGTCRMGAGDDRQGSRRSDASLRRQPLPSRRLRFDRHRRIPGSEIFDVFVAERLGDHRHHRVDARSAAKVAQLLDEIDLWLRRQVRRTRVGGNAVGAVAGHAGPGLRASCRRVAGERRRRDSDGSGEKRCDRTVHQSVTSRHRCSGSDRSRRRSRRRRGSSRPSSARRRPGAPDTRRCPRRESPTRTLPSCRPCRRA